MIETGENPSVKTHAIASAESVESPIVSENRKPGTRDYLLTQPSKAGEVEGYATQVSALEGDVVTLCVSVNRAQNVRCDVYRVGYYQGRGARLVQGGLMAAVTPQPMPSASASTGLLECQWASAFTLTIDDGFVTGYYLCKLTNDDGFESYVPFIVRESTRVAPLLVQASVTTWQAYNAWGAVSLYVNQLPASAGFTSSRGYQVSFDRPYAWNADIGSIEYGLVRFLEERGYDVAYVTNPDIDRFASLLENRKLFITSGHDEYWSVAERDAVQAARDAGLNLAFFSGNTAYRRIRYESSGSGAPGRVMTCYKSDSLDPHQNAPDTTNDFGKAPYARPENELLGVLWSGWVNMSGFPLLVADAEHWIYEGTGLAVNDSLGHVLGYEWDVVENNSVAPKGVEIVCDSPALHEYGYILRATSTVYYPTSSSFVFAAGSIGWCDGLGTSGIANASMQRVGENILRRAGLLPQTQATPALLPPPEVATSTSARVVGGSKEGHNGNVDGAADSARFRAPSGVAAGPNGELYVCDTGNGTIRKISRDGSVQTLVGHGVKGSPWMSTPIGIVVDAAGVVYFSDAGTHRIYSLDQHGSAQVIAGDAAGFVDAEDPSQATFDMPRGLALDPSGALYVADFRNDAIRRIDRTGVKTVVSNAGGPTAVAVAADGTIYYVGTWNAYIVRVAPDGTRTVLANPSQTFGDLGGPGVDARFRPVDGLVLTELGLIFSDTGNNRVRALLFDQENFVWTLLGTGTAGTNVGSGASTQLIFPRGLTAYGSGYAVADAANHRIVAFEV